jgi:hypothetical protein
MTRGVRRLGLGVAMGIALSAMAIRAAAQDSVPWPAANQLSVAVSARVQSQRGPSLTIEYTLANAASSKQSVQSFVVRTYVPNSALTAPVPWLSLRGLVQDSAAAHWFALDDESLIRPGQTLGGFTFTASGVLDIVPFRAQGNYKPPVAEEGDPVQAPPSLWTNSAPGWTIGVVPRPAQDPSALLTRAILLLRRACQLKWITSEDACHSLRAKLEHASQRRDELAAFLQELEAEHRRHVTDDAYWLLKVNIEALNP